MTAAVALFAPLRADEIVAAGEPPKARPKWTPIVPVPDDALPFRYRHPEHGEPVATWRYADAEGRTLAHVARFATADGSKTYLPVCWAEAPDGRCGWRAVGLPEPRPLYGLDLLAQRPGAVVVVTEGEKAADAAARLLPDAVVTTPMHGAKSPHKADWGALAGRAVVIWPDADAPGRDFGATVADLARKAGAVSVRVLDPLAVRADAPEGWDAADFEAEGGDGAIIADLIAGLEEAQPAKPKREGSPYFRLGPNGVEKLVEDDDGRREWRWFCSPLFIRARTRDDRNDAWGVLLELEDSDGVRKTWAMPADLLAGDGLTMRERLLSMGLHLSPGRWARNALQEYLVTSRTQARARCVSRVGWHGRMFCQPGATHGDTGGEIVVYQGRGALADPFRQGGTLADWRDTVAKAAAGNSRLAFALSAAFAGPLLHLTGSEGGGFHFRGASSTGKSTALLLAGSVWGGGDIGGFLRTWRTTSNALEGLAAMHCDTLLCLDELGQAAARHAAESAYLLSQGQSKARAGRSGEARQVSEWRILFLSTGEVGLADKIAEDGRGRMMAGQAVRVIDLPADAGRGHGIFERLPDSMTPADFAQALKGAALRSYGHAGVEWLKSLTADPEGAARRARQLQDAFVAAYAPAGADGQVMRAAIRFGLVAAAGEMARACGLLPWPEGEATAAAARLLADWIAARGGVGSLEAEQHVAAVRRFIELHGASRFQPMGSLTTGGDEGLHPERIINRAGFRRRADGLDGFEHLILPEVWKAEVCAGLDATAVAKTLIARGLLSPGDGGRACKKVRLPGVAGTARVYAVRANILADGEGAAPIGTVLPAGDVPF